MIDLKKLNFIENYTLNVIIGEIKDRILPAKLTKIHHVKGSGISFVLQTRNGEASLVFALHSQLPAFFLSEQPLTVSQKTATAFDQHLKGAHLIELEQVRYDRLIRLVWEVHHPLFGTKNLFMIGEFFGAFSNLILYNDENKILAFYRPQTLDDASGRLIAKGAIYHLPEPSGLKAFLEIDENDFHNFIKNPHASTNSIWKMLIHHCACLGPNIAKEIVQRSGLAENMSEKLDESQEKNLWQAFQQVRQQVKDKLADNNNFQFYFNDIDNTLVEISLIPKDPGEGLHARDYSSLNAGISEQWTKLIDGIDYNLEKKSLLSQLKKKLKKHSTLRKQLQNDLDKAENSDQLRLWGELIKANLKNLKRGLSEVTVTNFYDSNNAKITIPLNPKIDLHKNADKYFQQARKAEASIEFIKRRMKENNIELMFYHRTIEQLEPCQTNDEFMEIKKKIVPSLKLNDPHKTKKEKQLTTKFREFVLPGEWHILVGRNNKENDTLTHRVAALDDLWLHTQSIQGSHVVIRREGKKSDIPPEVIEQAAAIAAFYSKAKHSSKVPVVYVEVRHVRKPKGSDPGFVTYSNEKTMMVEPRLPEKSIEK